MNRKIPVYIVCGFLGSGKTTLIDRLTRRRPGCVRAQMEEGMTAAAGEVLPLPLYTPGAAEEIEKTLWTLAVDHPVQELWVEWNGMVPFTAAEALFLQSHLAWYYEIRRVIFVGTPDFLLHMLGKTGDAVVTQLAKADALVLMAGKDTDYGKQTQAEEILKEAAPGRPIFFWPDLESPEAARRLLAQRKDGRAAAFFFGAAALCAGYVWLAAAPEGSYAGLRQMLTYSLATLLQALSFLLLGVLCSSAMQLYVSPLRIERWLASGRLKGMAAALLGGFLFPVCDCASIPVFRSLLTRGVPLPASLLFLLSGPLINPVVIASTWAAFWGQPSVAAGRVLLGIAAALAVSLSFWRYRGLEGWHGGGAAFMAGGASPDDGAGPRWLARWLFFLRHSEEEFFRMAPYVMGGAFLSAAFQVFGASLWAQYLLSGPMGLTILLMMGLAFCLSLCSTADAVIARNLSVHVPLPGVMAFLLMGPMMDIKNFLLLRSLFPAAFVLRLTAAIVIACGAFSMGFAIWQGGGLS